MGNRRYDRGKGHKRMTKQTSVPVNERALLYCEDCNDEVWGDCIRVEWYQHCSRGKFKPPEAYKRIYFCPYCRNFIPCKKGTYEPISERITSSALRLGRSLTWKLVVKINTDFGFKRAEIANCLGFDDPKEIKNCNDVDRLREAYRIGLKLRERLNE